MVEVFKTNVEEKEEALLLVTLLSDHFPLYRINFDLHDCDKVLRVEGDRVLPGIIVELMTGRGYECMVLE
jgi:hypothetical protein